MPENSDGSGNGFACSYRDCPPNVAKNWPAGMLLFTGRVRCQSWRVPETHPLESSAPFHGFRKRSARSGIEKVTVYQKEVMRSNSREDRPDLSPPPCLSENSDGALPFFLHHAGQDSDRQRAGGRAEWLFAFGKSGHVADRDCAKLVSPGAAIRSVNRLRRAAGPPSGGSVISCTGIACPGIFESETGRDRASDCHRCSVSYWVDITIMDSNVSIHSSVHPENSLQNG